MPYVVTDVVQGGNDVVIVMFNVVTDVVQGGNDVVTDMPNVVTDVVPVGPPRSTPKTGFWRPPGFPSKMP